MDTPIVQCGHFTFKFDCLVHSSLCLCRLYISPSIYQMGFTDGWVIDIRVVVLYIYLPLGTGVGIDRINSFVLWFLPYNKLSLIGLNLVEVLLLIAIHVFFVLLGDMTQSCLLPLRCNYNYLHYSRSRSCTFLPT